MITSRRYDLDWLRVFAFAVLIYFHTAIIFIPGGLPLIQNAQNSDFLGVFVDISSQFRLSLLFFISGVGVAFARRSRNTKEFIIERSQRLLIPFFIGLFLIVPIMVYTEKIFLNQFTGGFLSFYPKFFTEGVYPSGNLSWHHFWFIAYLYIFCLLGLMVFPWLEKKDERRKVMLLNHLDGYGIYSPILAILTIEILLRPAFPGFRDLIHDWASFSHWYVVFLCGYLIAHREKLLDFATQYSYLSLFGAVASTWSVFLIFGEMEFNVSMSDPNLIWLYLTYAILKSIMVWCSILSCLGIAGRYFRYSTPSLSYLNEAVYPLFSLHLLVIVVLGYWISQMQWGVWVKFLLISNLTAILILVIYHCCIRPFDNMRFLFGVPPRPQKPAPAITSIITDN